MRDLPPIRASICQSLSIDSSCVRTGIGERGGCMYARDVLLASLKVKVQCVVAVVRYCRDD